MSVCLKQEILMMFTDGELPSDEFIVAERHISSCAACKRELESIRARSVKVNALLSSLAPEDTANADAMPAVSIRYSGANARMRWAAVTSVGVLAAALLLFVMIRRERPAPAPNAAKTVTSAPVPSVEKKEVLVATVAKPAHGAAPTTRLKVRKFQALDDGEPIETGMIYRVSLPASSVPNGVAMQSTRRIPAEVIVDEFGKVRAIRFLQ